MKIISKVEDLKSLNLTAVQLSDAHIQINLDGKVIYDWVEPLFTQNDDVWGYIVIDGMSYDLNYFTGEFTDDDKPKISFYGLTELDECNGQYDICRNDDAWHTIEVISLIEQVMTEMQDDFARGDLECIEELLKFVPIENLKGYLPSIY